MRKIFKVMTIPKKCQKNFKATKTILLVMIQNYIQKGLLKYFLIILIANLNQ